MTRPTPAEEIRALKTQIDRQAEAIVQRNIKILKLERQIAATDAKERASHERRSHFVRCINAFVCDQRNRV